MAAKRAAAAAPTADETKVDAPVEAVEPTDATPVEAPAAPAKKAAKASGPITVKFRDHEGKETSRVFSADVHGEDFAALAEEFKATNATRLIVD